MFEVLTVMLPIFALIAIGFGAARGGFFPGPQRAGLAGFVLNFALPAVILVGFSRQDLAGSFSIGYVAAYAAGSIVAFGTIFAVLRFVRKRPLAHAALGGLGASASNTGFIGYPVALLVFGPTAMIALPFTMLVENILILPLAIALAEFGTSKEPSLSRILRQTVVRLARMPLLLAILVGLCIALLGLRPPVPVLTTLEILATASAPCALFVVGGMIADLRVGDLSVDVVWIAAGKLLIHPAAVAAFMLTIPGIPPELAATGILFSCVSMVTIYPLLSARFGFEKMAAAAIAIATIVGLASLVAVISILLPLV